MTQINHDELIVAVEKAIVAASAGDITLEALRESKGSLMDVGYTSIAFMALIESLEVQFGITVDPFQDPEELSTLNGIVNYIEKQNIN